MQQQILRRLEIVKNSLILEDFALIEGQIAQLEAMSNQGDVLAITRLLASQNFAGAATLIEDYLKKYSGLVPFDDVVVAGLRLELKTLEARLERLSVENNTMVNEMDDFRYQYHRQLGDIISKILAIKQQILEKEVELASTKNEAEKKQAHQKAKAEAESFTSEQEALAKDPPFVLDRAKAEKLKKMYRKATRLCHPDVVASEFKKQANKLMAELSVAYRKKDFARVAEIYQNLEASGGFLSASSSISDKEVLVQQIASLKEKCGQLEQENQALKTNETYVMVQKIDDFDAYFADLRGQFLSEYEQLQQKLATVAK